MAASCSEQVDQLGVVESEHDISDLDFRNVGLGVSFLEFLIEHLLKFCLHVSGEALANRNALGVVIGVDVVSEPVESLLRDLHLERVVTGSDCGSVPHDLLEGRRLGQIVDGDQKQEGDEDTNARYEGDLLVLVFDLFLGLCALVLHEEGGIGSTLSFVTVPGNCTQSVDI